jgi:hypothetical protein
LEHAPGLGTIFPQLPKHQDFQDISFQIKGIPLYCDFYFDFVSNFALA